MSLHSTVDGDEEQPPLRVLLVEDSEDDAMLTLRALRTFGYRLTAVRVDTRPDMIARLRAEPWDVVLCDYAMPEFSAASALAVVKELAIDVPVVIVSGTVGETAAVAFMRSGAHDYVQKSKLARLGAVVEREVQNAKLRATQRGSAEALRLSEERHRLLVENSSDILSIMDRDGVLRYVSPRVEAALGRPATEIAGTCGFDWISSKEGRRAAEASFAEVLSAPGKTVTAHSKVKHADGSLRYFESILVNRLDEPAIAGIVSTTRDITEREHIEEERRARLHAESASRTKSGFLASMSHELRTPLNAIIGFSELMGQGIAGPLSDRQTVYVGNVLQAGRHLLSLVNDILDLSKIEAGKMTLEREWTDLNGLVVSVQQIVEPLAAGRSIAVEVAIDPSLSQLYVDPTRLKQIVYNLVSNGIKFTPHGGTVRVTADSEGDAIHLGVHDTGIGVRPEDIPRLFREFEQLESGAPGDKAEGTGLGLALTKRLVELHGGTISVTSEVGTGSTFTVTLPDVRKPARTGETRPPVEGAPAKVLVVDDDPNAMALIAAHARAAGVSVLFARTAEEALRIAAYERPSAITLDILLPNIDGWAILSCLKQDPATAAIPVIVISVFDDVARSRELGAVRHLTKPVAREVLHEALREVGIPVRTVAGSRVLVVGGKDLDGIADSLLEVGCKVVRTERLASEAPASRDYDFAIVDLTTTSLDAPLAVPVLGIVDSLAGLDSKRAPESHSQRRVSYLEKSDSRGMLEVITRIHETIVPRPDIAERAPAVRDEGTG